MLIALALDMAPYNENPIQIAAYVVSGIGFLASRKTCR
jgi:uncharacterized membrane protein YhiD involved in acid resistance